MEAIPAKARIAVVMRRSFIFGFLVGFLAEFEVILFEVDG